VGQGSALFPILSALYITSIFHIFEKRSQNILSTIFASTLSFVDDSLFISQENVTKNQTEIHFIVIVLSPLFSSNLALQLNITNWRFYTSLRLQRILTPSSGSKTIRRTYFTTK